MDKSNKDSPQDNSRPWERLEDLLGNQELNREQLGLVLQARKQLRMLLEQPGWDLLAKLAQKQRDARRDAILDSVGFNPEVEPIRQVLQQEFARGEVAGLQLMFTLPEVLVKEYTGLIESAKLVEDDDNGNASADE